jgi:hypothetical protein
MLAAEWAVVSNGNTPTQTWQKNRYLRRFLKGWAKNLSAPAKHY